MYLLENVLCFGPGCAVCLICKSLWFVFKHTTDSKEICLSIPIKTTVVDQAVRRCATNLFGPVLQASLENSGNKTLDMST